MIKKTLYVSGSLLGIYILFEFFIEIHTKKQLKKQIKRLMNKTGSNIGDCNYKIISLNTWIFQYTLRLCW